MAKPNPPDLGPEFDTFTIRGSYDDAWEYMVRFVESPDGLKVWALTIAPIGLNPYGLKPADVPGPGINTRILRAIRFPYVRQLMKEKAEAYLAGLLEERDRATPEGQAIIDRELPRARREFAGAEPPTVQPTGRPPTPQGVNAQLALDVLDYKDHFSYRKELRALWSEREGEILKTKTVDTRMKRLRDDGWLTGYGKLAANGPQLKTWMKHNPESRKRITKEE